MTPEEATEHELVYGKKCYNCDKMAADDYEDEGTEKTRFWCDLKMIPEVNKTGALNCYCGKWVVRDDSN